MTSLLFVIAIFLVLLSFWVKRKKKSDIKSLWRQAPGRNHHEPIEIERFDEMDYFVRRQKCFCNGSLEVVSEGSKTIDGQNLRVIRADCGECEEELYFFFKMNQLLH